MSDPCASHRHPRHTWANPCLVAARIGLLAIVAATPLSHADEPVTTTQPSDTFEPAAEAANAPNVTVSNVGLLDVNVHDTPIASVLEMLSYQARSNIVTSTSVTGNISANLYDVTLEAALDAILIPNQLTYRKMNGVIYVGTVQETNANGPLPQPRVFELKYISRATAAAAVESLLSERGTIAAAESQSSGSGSGGADSLSSVFGEAGVDYLIVIDTPDRLKAIERVIGEIDVRPKQVLIEATILRATLNEDNQLGIDLTLLNGVDFQDVTSTSDAAANLQTGQVPPRRFDNTTFNVNTDLLDGFPGSGFTFGIIKNNVAAFVRALESVTDVSVLAHPKVLALNKHEAEIIVGRRDGYITTMVTETAAVQSVEFLETGTQILLRPVINPDGTVRLDVRPKDSNGGLNSSNLPFEETTETHVQLLLDDGHTVLIGGLFRERTVSSKTQVPVLGDVPILGHLFKRSSDQTVREEVIILLTVHVLKETPEEQEQFREIMEDIERIRVGSRQGLMGTGRDRLAQAFYQEALSQAEAGKFDLALLNARMSLHNQPRHLGAFKLKEELLGRRMWDGGYSRSQTVLLDLLDGASEATAGEPDAGHFGHPPLDHHLMSGHADVIEKGEKSP